eukprot:scpid39224/ scgid23604/ Ferric-chelate reductase 1; Stromal cell-derived receptor 2
MAMTGAVRPAILLGLAMVIGVAYWHGAEAYSAGAPSSACGSMMPGHGFASQPVSSGGTNGGFTVTTSSSTYQVGATYTMTIAGSTNAFAGFMCQARTTSNGQLSVFTGTVPAGTQKISGCTDAYTHTSKTAKTSVTFSWKVNSASVTSFKFVCTFVQSYNTYFVQVPGSDLTLMATPTTVAPTTAAPTTAVPMTGTTQPGATAGPTTAAPSTAPPTTLAPTTMAPTTMAPTTMAPTTQRGPASTSMVSASDCGTGKSCYRDPPSCTTDCTYFYSQKPIGSTQVEIELSAKTQGWVAVGFSTDRIMGDDDVMGCNVASDGTTVIVKNAFNQGKSNVIDLSTNPAPFITNTFSSFVNGQIYCRFTRTLTTNSNRDKNLAAPNKYHLLFGTNTAASGRGGSNIGMPGKHNSIPPITTEAYTATDTSVANFNANIKVGLIKVHGFFMIIAWIGLAGIGLFMPRFMKKAWDVPKDEVAWWFKLHRPLMVTVWLMSLLGFIFILAYKKGKWSTGSSAHPGIGLATFILCMIQPFMAMIRKKLNKSQRKIFNWTHRTVGLAAHALGAIAVYLGMDLFRQNYGLTTAVLYLWAAWAAIEAAIWIGYEIRLLVSPVDPTEKIAADASIRKALLMVYAATCIVLGIVMAIMVVAHRTGSSED